MPTKKPAANKVAPKKSASESAPETEPALKEFFTDSIKDIYWAEKKLVTSLPKMQKAATSDALKACIGDHLAVTREQVSRLEKVFELLGEKAQGKKCEAMEGILKEGEGVLEDTEEGTATRDVAIIMASQKIEHYEIASYGGLATLAGTLGLDKIRQLLAETLAEEKEADELLTGIAENDINYEAANEDEPREAA